MKQITIEEAGQILKEKDNFLVLMHKSPDGDAVGCGYGLCMALRSIGKRAEPLCGDEIPPLFGYVTGKLETAEADPQYIISVDLATTKLLSGKALEYQDRIDLCIDHHRQNSGFAEAGYVDPASASCAEIIMKILEKADIPITPDIADALFMGAATDTGCFKYSNVTPETHRAAARLMEYGADSLEICRIFFDTKTKTRLALEKMIYETIRYYAEGRVALVTITKKMVEDSGATQGDMDGIAGIAKQIEGVAVGVTAREKDDGEYRISVRTNGNISAGNICGTFGGGGHFAAAGCSIYGSEEEIREKIIGACLKEIGDKN